MSTGTGALTVQQEAIKIERSDLCGRELEQDLSCAFLKEESINPEFGLAWLRHLASSTLTDDETAYLYTVQCGSGEFLALPLRVHRKTRQAHSLSNFYTSLYSPVVASIRPRVLLEALFDYLRTTERITGITLSPLVADNALFDDYQIALKQTKWRGIHSWHCFWNWTHTVSSPNYLDYLAARPSILRNTIARKTRKFLDSGRGRITLITEPDSITEGIEQFQSVYQRSWKKTEPHAAFIPGLLKLAAEKKWLRLAVAYYDDRPIAAQLWMVSGGTASIFKLAYDEDFKQMSPGTILSAFLMQHVIDADGVTTIDYLSGNDSYKESWMTNRRERRGIAAYNTNNFGGMARYAARQLKQLYNRIMH
ncbi:MAG: hypothetical protein ACI9B9_001413 [Halioglobus sp.]|jgi:hypothetical protein